MRVRHILTFTFLVGVFAVLNYFCRKNLPEAYADSLSYNQLYFVKDQLHIIRISKTEGDSLRVVFGGKEIGRDNRFEVWKKGEKIAEYRGADCKVPASLESTFYTIRINGGDSCVLRVEFPDYSISSLSLDPPGLRAVDDWCSEGNLRPGEDRSMEIARYLRDSMGIEGRLSSEEKVLRIGKYILSITAGKYGPPSDSMERLSAIDALNCVRDDRSKLQCGDFTRILNFFSNKAGVPARYIESGEKKNGLNNGPHVVSEVWLEDQHCWAHVDLTDGIIFVKKGGHYLNTVDLYRLLRIDADDTTIQALHYEGSRIDNMPYGRVSFFGKNAFNYNNRLTFYYRDYWHGLATPSNPLEKLKSLLYPHAWYAVYSDNAGIGNWQLILRLLTSGLLLSSFLAWVFVLLQWLIKRRRQR